jgi:hypothetical protein
MNRILSFLFILLHVSLINGQFKTTITLDWQNQNNYPIGERVYQVPHFNNFGFVYDQAEKRIGFEQNFKVEGIPNESSLIVSNIVYENININGLDIDLIELSDKINLNVQGYQARDDNYLQLVFNPIIKDASGVKRVKSLDIVVDLNGSKTSNNLRTGYLGVQNSVLNSGQWFRFYVEKSGIYKINRSFLESLGMQNIGDPRRLKIYSHGGKMLPMMNNANMPPDLPELAIQVIGEEDGNLDNNDYVLVYCEGVDNWDSNHLTHNNLYSKRAYYYITNGGDLGKRIQNYIEPTASPTLTVNKADFHAYYEKDLNNIGRLGRRWFGEQFGLQNSHSMSFAVPGISNEQVTIDVSLASTSISASTMAFELNGGNLSTFNLPPRGQNNEYFVANYTLTTNATENFSFKLNYNNGGLPNGRAFLDYIIVKGKRHLSGINKQFPFELIDAISQTGVVQYQFSNIASIQSIWHITDIFNVEKKDNTGSIDFKDNLGISKKYIAFSDSDAFTPLKESNARVNNQNLKYQIFHNAQGQFEDIDYIIVAPNFLTSEAERLAQLHRNVNQLKVKVVTLESIYQEFSSGKQDISAIRNFVRYIYENASSPANRIKYLNLFGDTSFDYLDRVPANINTNIVPAFNALHLSGNGDFSFTNDDFFVFMNENEGVSGTNFLTGLPDIAVGRMLVSSTQQTREMVNKIYDYEDQKSYNQWRNYVVGVSDDTANGETLNEHYLQEGVNSLIDELKIEKPFINGTKILMDAYQVQTTAGGIRYPDARRDFLRAFENGSLAIFYLGHGGIEGLATERVYEKFDGANVANRYRYPLFVTITCEFTRYDNPYAPTSGEYTYWNPSGGAIAMITTTRDFPGGSTATNANRNVASKLFNFGGGNDYPMAEALRLVKLEQMSLFRIVSFVGCPALKLAIPEPKIVLTKINDLPAEGSNIVFQALSTYTIEGEVRDETGTALLNGYNGEVSIRIFDKNIQRTTLNNRGGTLPALNFQTLGETIFRGNATVNNGVFNMTFVVPRDIKIPIGNGRMSFYAKSPSPILQDQTGYSSDILVGGVNPNPPVDNTPPTCQLFMNDESFVNGGITNKNPILIGVFEDENGINTAAGIGHDMVAILDGDESNPFILNDYYETELDNYRKGRIRFPFRNLSPGLHTITVRIWDVYNNPSTCEIEFLVTEGDQLTLTNVLNYPNPFVSYTQFWFTHDRPFEPLNVQVQIFTVTGKVVKTINQTVYNEGFLSRDLTWDGKDDFGDKIGKGVYVYKLTVESTLSNKKAEKIEKLVIL